MEKVNLNCIDEAVEKATVRNCENGNLELDMSIFKRMITTGIEAEVDIKMPKQSVVLQSIDVQSDGQVIYKDVLAENGKWRRLPKDNEMVQITYKQ